MNKRSDFTDLAPRPQRPLLVLKQALCQEASWVLDTAKVGIGQAVWCPYRALGRVFPEEEKYVLGFEQLKAALSSARASRLPPWIELGEGEDVFLPSTPKERRLEVVAMLRLLFEAGIGVAFTTRGTLEGAEPFLELAKQYPKLLSIRVGVLSTDPKVEARWEKEMPSHQQRLAFAKVLQGLGIAIEVEIGPIIPFANDDAKHLRDLARAIARMGLSQVSTRWIEDAPALERQIEAEISPSTARLVTGWFRHTAQPGRRFHRRGLPPNVRAPRIRELRTACELYGLNWQPCECELRGQSHSCLKGHGMVRGAQLSLLELIA